MKREETIQKIDVDGIFKSKNPRLYKALPRFLFKYLKRIVHQEDINDFLDKNRNRLDIDFAQSIVDHFKIRMQVIGAENIPEQGGCILAANHPIGSVDAMALICAVAERRKDIRFLVNDILMNIINLRGIFVPVNTLGKNAHQSLREMEALYASEKAILVFPAGLVSRLEKGKVQDLEWKKSFVSKARKYSRFIVPVYISGRNSSFFYALGKFRKFLGIKANIEMLYLADETFRQRGNTITLIFGEPIQPSRLLNTENDSVWAEKIKQHIYRMGDSGKPLAFGY
jgi:putative hemolysin